MCSIGMRRGQKFSTKRPRFKSDRSDATVGPRDPIGKLSATVATEAGGLVGGVKGKTCQEGEGSSVNISLAKRG